jgi:hypothetical protein
VESWIIPDGACLEGVEEVEDDDARREEALVTNSVSTCRPAESSLKA